MTDLQVFVEAESPQFPVVGAYLGYDPSLSDPRQRFAYLRLAKLF